MEDVGWKRGIQAAFLFFNHYWRRAAERKPRFELVNQTVYLHIKLNFIINCIIGAAKGSSNEKKKVVVLSRGNYFGNQLISTN